MHIRRRRFSDNIQEIINAGSVEADRVLENLHKTCEGKLDREWRNRIFAQFPKKFARRIAQEYEEYFIFENRRAANLRLLDHQDFCNKGKIPLTSNAADLENLAKAYAKEMRATVAHIHDDVQAVVMLWKIAERKGIEPPNIYDPNITPKGILNRLFDHHWWYRRLLSAHNINYETEAIRLGFVSRYAGNYLSEDTFQRYKIQIKRNQKILKQMIAVNEADQEFTLAELSDNSVSNPVNRRSELMCRLAGFEKIADDLDHVAEFYTITCPSKMHARLTKTSGENPKYNNTTPHQAQQYLCKVWSRIRAKLDRDGIEVYGFRVAEPHQDGTPHWHILLFTPANNIPKVRSIIQHHALQDDGDEKGASKHRFKYEPIDKTKGSAVGYIAKYVSKNIDGYAIDEDEDGNDAKSSAERVRAWASTWHIRQFQQFGGAPVSIWRELRRADIKLPEGVLLAEVFNAADIGDWALFLNLLGGPTVKRKDIPITIAKKESIQLGKYGDPLGHKIYGVQFGNITWPTRIHQWKILKGNIEHDEESDIEIMTKATEELEDGGARDSTHRTDDYDD